MINDLLYVILNHKVRLLHHADYLTLVMKGDKKIVLYKCVKQKPYLNKQIQEHMISSPDFWWDSCCISL